MNIGRDDGTGTITVNTVSLNNKVIVQSPGAGGPIVVNGPMQTNGNDVTLNAGTSIDVNADITTAGGNITITSGGTIDTTGSFLRSLSDTGVGGDITLNAVGDITTGGQLISYGTSQGGDIRLTSSTGGINVGDVLAAGANVIDVDGTLLFITDRGGLIILNASGNITAGEMFSVGELNDGDISITSATGSINITGPLGVPNNPSGGTGGNVILNAAGNITIRDVSTAGFLGGGNINITSNTGAIDSTAGTFDASSETGNGGAIIFSAADSIVTGPSPLRAPDQEARSPSAAVGMSIPVSSRSARSLEQPVAL